MDWFKWDDEKIGDFFCLFIKWRKVGLIKLNMDLIIYVAYDGQQADQNTLRMENENEKKKRKERKEKKEKYGNKRGKYHYSTLKATPYPYRCYYSSVQRFLCAVITANDAPHQCLRIPRVALSVGRQRYGLVGSVMGWKKKEKKKQWRKIVFLICKRV